MKKFTAKQFNRTPGPVFDAARDDGKCVITHGPNNEFELKHIKTEEQACERVDTMEKPAITEEYLLGFQERMRNAIRTEIDKRKSPEGHDNEMIINGFVFKVLETFDHHTCAAFPNPEQVRIGEIYYYKNLKVMAIKESE